MRDSDGRVVSQEVREYLHRALPASRLREVSANSVDEPLLLLTMPQLVAGFGFASTDIEDKYGQLYGAFKEEYSTRRHDWDQLELAFVLCVPADSPGLDFFGSAVETDVYFCRKYVLPFNGGPVRNALARLPFVPLFSAEEETIRPPSAQTFLQQCGVPPTLAKYVVVKGERSPNTIVEDCIGGGFGWPQVPTRIGSFEASKVLEKATSMRVESLSIENFRAYRKKKEILFGSDLTVLYGPNGFGKTSVFDAVDFAFTGEIGRLRVRGEDRFRHVANHLDGDGADGVVTLSFTKDDRQHRLIRHVNDRKWPRLDGVRMNRKAALEKLTGWRGATADRVENMVNLFRATHLFSQEHQELATNFRSDCELSSDVVSRLLAFEDYHSGRSKVSHVCGVLRSEIATLDSDQESLSKELVADETELESVGRATEGGGSSTDWERVASSLFAKVKKEGLEIPSDMPKLDTLKEWRITFETRGAQLREQIEDLRKCLAVAERLPRKLANLMALEGRIDSAKVIVAEASGRLKAAEETHRHVQRRIALLEMELSEFEKDGSGLSWLQESAPRYSALGREEADALRQLDQARDQLQEAEVQQSTLQGRLSEDEKERSEVVARAEEASKRLSLARVLSSGLEAWTEKRSRLEEIAREERRVSESADELALLEKVSSESIETLVEEETQLVGQIEALEDRRGELGELVMRIETYIEGSVCPVCGEDHGSFEKLLDRIARHLGEGIAKEERLRLDGVRQKVEELNTAVRERQSDRRTVALKQRELARERQVIETAVSDYEKSLAEIGIAGQKSGQVVKEELEGLYSSWQRTTAEFEARATQMLPRVEGLRKDLNDATERRNAKRAELVRLKSERDRISASRQHLADDPRTEGEIGLDTPIELILERRKLVEAKIRSHRESLEQELQSVVVDGERLKKASVELESKENDLATLLENVSTLKASCREMEATLVEVGITDDQEREDQVLHGIEALENQAKENEELIRDIIGVELIVDSATTKAAFSGLQQRVRLRKSALAELGETRKSYVWWLDYFEELQRLLSFEQDKAVQKFTQEYGPRTSSIQRRLRSVYGFDDVEIRSDESKISVRVSRRGVQVRPTDYFSQSQQQTLLLGLFLTASVSQTWSAMAPIFLDDPVTHFDDLNTYAFLDLIDGLLNDPEAEGRQFVLSTCDEKLLQLARQKFAYRKDGARFYTFKGIGVEGPIVV